MLSTKNRILRGYSEKLDNFEENKEARTFSFFLFYDTGFLRFIGILYL